MNFVNENHRKHYELWMSLSNYPYNNEEKRLSQKGDFCKERIYNHCYACEEANSIRLGLGSESAHCDYCPICWTVLEVNPLIAPCLNYGALYERWTRSSDLSTRSVLAYQIAHLPWRSKPSIVVTLTWKEAQDFYRGDIEAFLSLQEAVGEKLKRAIFKGENKGKNIPQL